MELMITLALIGVLAALAVPSMRDFIRNGRLTSASNDLLRSLNLARTEAIKRQTNVAVCATADPDASDGSLVCSYGPFQGWFVFEDTNADGQHAGGEPVLERHALVDSTVTVNSDHDGIVSYAGTGFAGFASGVALTQTQNVMLCDHRGNTAIGTDSTARALFVTTTGRARVSRLKTDVDTAAANIGSTSCP
jgi:type IV fimbrial biogenesis protein FimT